LIYQWTKADQTDRHTGPDGQISITGTWQIVMHT